MDDQVIGHPAYVITHPDRDFAVPCGPRLISITREVGIHPALEDFGVVWPHHDALCRSGSALWFSRPVDVTSSGCPEIEHIGECLLIYPGR